mgnify:CR=1 FL=1
MSPDFEEQVRDIVYDTIKRLLRERQFDVLADLVEKTGVTRALLWTIEDDLLKVCQETSGDGSRKFADLELSPMESTAVVLEFLSRFPDESGSGIIALADAEEDVGLSKVAPSLKGQIDMAGTRSRWMAQVRAGGLFCGFIDLHQEDRRRLPDASEKVRLMAAALVVSMRFIS